MSKEREKLLHSLVYLPKDDGQEKEIHRSSLPTISEEILNKAGQPDLSYSESEFISYKTTIFIAGTLS